MKHTENVSDKRRSSKRRSSKETDPLKKKKNKKNTFGTFCNILGTFLLIVVILLCVPLTIPRLFGCQVYNVVSGSMEPAIPTGSLVYVQSAVASEIETNDIIAFYGENDTGAIITHRVVKNQVVSGQFVTKGDANEQEDLNPVSYDRFIGKVTFHVPVLGSILALVATTYGKVAAVGLVVAAILLRLIAERGRGDETDR